METGKIRTLPVIAIVLLFLAANLWAMSQGSFLLNLLPLGLLLVGIAFLSLEKLLLIIVFFSPLSLSLKYLAGDMGINLSLPTEPLLAAMLLLFLLKTFRDGRVDKKILLHPVSCAIYLYLGWMLITCFTSSSPLVSFKYFVARLWFITGYFFVAAHVFREDREGMKKYLWAYLLSFSLVIIYTLINQAGHGLVNQQASHTSVHPFYNDHTAYGASLVFLIPVLTAFTAAPGTSRYRLLSGAFLCLFLLGLVFSYTRAAWLSLIVAGLVFLLIRFRVRIPVLLFSLLVVGSFLFMYRTGIRMKMEENKVTSSTNFVSHLRSVTNITNDASNAERINRWKSALRMYRERPVYGWGPGTYQFRYAAFQNSRERTVISTDFGDMGTAHSEYLGPLAETGFPGLLSFLWLAGVVLLTGWKGIGREEEKGRRYLTIGLLLGLVSYFTHGLMNNFLDTDKASALFWGFMAMLVVMDLERDPVSSVEKKKKKKGLLQEETDCKKQ